ncbi:MAG: flippase-like domain-containing protein [Bdellovibrionales bacterium]|nr:flippase-like domain-containing protein [Bdellovibrionales bacterium]
MKVERVRAYLRYVGLLLLLGLLYSIDVTQASAILTSMDPRWFVVAALCHAAFTFFKSIRWHALLAAQGVEYPLGRAIAVYHAGSFFSLITPGRIGDVIKIDYLKRDRGVPYRVGLSSVVVDRLLDLVLLASSAFLGVSMLGASVGVLQSLVLFTVLLAAVVALAKSDWAIPRMLGAMGRMPLVGRRVVTRAESIAHLHQELQTLLSRRILVPLLCSVASYAAIYYGSYAIAAAQGLHLTLLQVLYAISITSIVSLIPVSVSGIGTRDLVMVAIFARFGLESEQAIAFSLGYLLINIVFGNGVGAYYWFREPRQKRHDLVEHLETS